MKVTFLDNDTGQEWVEHVEILPRPGDYVVLDRAPKGGRSRSPSDHPPHRRP
jgi:hypothetical protein